MTTRKSAFQALKDLTTETSPAQPKPPQTQPTQSLDDEWPEFDTATPIPTQTVSRSGQNTPHTKPNLFAVALGSTGATQGIKRPSTPLESNKKKMRIEPVISEPLAFDWADEKSPISTPPQKPQLPVQIPSPHSQSASTQPPLISNSNKTTTPSLPSRVSHSTPIEQKKTFTHLVAPPRPPPAQQPTAPLQKQTQVTTAIVAPLLSTKTQKPTPAISQRASPVVLSSPVTPQQSDPKTQTPRAAPVFTSLVSPMRPPQAPKQAKLFSPQPAAPVHSPNPLQTSKAPKETQTPVAFTPSPVLPQPKQPIQSLLNRATATPSHKQTNITKPTPSHDSVPYRRTEEESIFFQESQSPASQGIFMAASQDIQAEDCEHMDSEFQDYDVEGELEENQARDEAEDFDESRPMYLEEDAEIPEDIHEEMLEEMEEKEDTTYSRTQGISEKFNHLAHRRIPGPVGTLMLTGKLPQTKSQQNALLINSPSKRGAKTVMDQLEIDGLFRKPPWLQFLFASKLPPYAPPNPETLLTCNIALIQSGERCGDKISKLVALVSSITTDGSVILQDPSGAMEGSFSSPTFSEKNIEVESGCVLFLQNISVLPVSATYNRVIMTPQNIEKVIPASLKKYPVGTENINSRFDLKEIYSPACTPTKSTKKLGSNTKASHTKHQFPMFPEGLTLSPSPISKPLSPNTGRGRGRGRGVAGKGEASPRGRGRGRGDTNPRGRGRGESLGIGRGATPGIGRGST